MKPAWQTLPAPLESPRSECRARRNFNARWLAVLAIFLTGAAFAQNSAKPNLAVFPLGGTSNPDLRDRVGFSIRAKLDRDGTYDPIDGPTMADMAAPAQAPITFDTGSDAITNLAQGSDAVVLVWGDLSPAGAKDLLRLHILDLRTKPPKAQTFQSPIADAQQVRFVVEKFLATLPGLAAFAHPDDDPVHHDPPSDALFARNPNLVPDADFSSAGRWTGIYRLEEYPLPISDTPPLENKIAILREAGHNVLSMNLNTEAAQSNGLAALSRPIPISPGIRYRISFAYRSDGPSQQSFVKGYAAGKSLSGQPEDIEIYRLQLPPSGPTAGKWQTVEADLDPYNPGATVERLRVDFYSYMNPGQIAFDKVILKAVGRQPGPLPKLPPVPPATAPSPIR